MILSIDVGIRNLAMCMLDETSNLIVQWDVSGVPPEHKDGLFVSLRDHLDDKPWILKADTVLIEKQPDKNRKMKMVEHFLHTYFVIRNPKAETIIYDARFKIPDFAGPGKAMYTKRKKASIERCQQFIWNNTVMHTGFLYSMHLKRKMILLIRSCKLLVSRNVLNLYKAFRKSRKNSFLVNLTRTKNERGTLNQI